MTQNKSRKWLTARRTTDIYNWGERDTEAERTLSYLRQVYWRLRESKVGILPHNGRVTHGIIPGLSKLLLSLHLPDCAVINLTDALPKRPPSGLLRLIALECEVSPTTINNQLVCIYGVMASSGIRKNDVKHDLELSRGFCLSHSCIGYPQYMPLTSRHSKARIFENV